MMGGYWSTMVGAGTWFGPIWMVVWWVGLIALIAWGIARVTQSGRATTNASFGAAGPSPEGARAILDRRFAAGEINAEAYAQARRLLDDPVLHA